MKKYMWIGILLETSLGLIIFFFSCLGIGDFDDIQRSTGWAYDNYMGVTGLSAIHFLILGKSKISLT